MSLFCTYHVRSDSKKQQISPDYIMEAVSPCVLCNCVQQYLLFAKPAVEFAQPSIAQPHIQDMIMSVPGLCMWLRDSPSSNGYSAKPVVGAEKQVTDYIRALRLLGFNIWWHWHSLCTTIVATLTERWEIQNSWPVQTYRPCAKILHWTQISSSPATTKGITVMLSFLT